MGLSGCNPIISWGRSVLWFLIKYLLFLTCWKSTLSWDPWRFGSPLPPGGSILKGQWPDQEAEILPKCWTWSIISDGGNNPCQSFKDVASFLFSRFLSVTLVFPSKSQRSLRVGLAVPILSTVAALRKMVAEEGGIPVDEVWWGLVVGLMDANWAGCLGCLG